MGRLTSFCRVSSASGSHRGAVIAGGIVLVPHKAIAGSKSIKIGGIAAQILFESAELGVAALWPKLDATVDSWFNSTLTDYKPFDISSRRFDRLFLLPGDNRWPIFCFETKAGRLRFSLPGELEALPGDAVIDSAGDLVSIIVDKGHQIAEGFSFDALPYELFGALYA